MKKGETTGGKSRVRGRRQSKTRTRKRTSSDSRNRGVRVVCEIGIQAKVPYLHMDVDLVQRVMAFILRLLG